MIDVLPERQAADAPLSVPEQQDEDMVMLADIVAPRQGGGKQKQNKRKHNKQTNTLPQVHPAPVQALVPFLPLGSSGVYARRCIMRTYLCPACV